MPSPEPLVVMNGNQAVGLGIMAAGIEMVAMYPITPATSVSHYLGRRAASASAASSTRPRTRSPPSASPSAPATPARPRATITSGPGLALKTEFLGLAVMAEMPLVVVVVQRGGPSTGLPTKVEQGDLLAALYGEPGDAPKIVLAPATIEECFHFVVMARKLAEEFRGPVLAAHRRQPGHRRGAVPAPAPRGAVAGAGDRPVALAGGGRPLRLGPADRSLGAADPRPARRRVRAHRPRAHPQEQGRLRPALQPDRLRHAQPQAGHAAARSGAAAGPRRPRGRPAGGRLGLDAGRHRRGGRPAARRRASGCPRSTCASCRRSSPGSTPSSGASSG